MLTKINSPASVYMSFDAGKRSLIPHFVIWNGRSHKIIKTGFHHTYRQGRTLFHVFSVVSKSLFFRLVLNSETLHWRLEEISDGLPE